MPIPSEITEAVAAANIKNVAEAPAFYSGLAMADAVAHQRGINAIREAAIASAIRALVEVDPIEAVSASKVATGNDLAAQLAQLTAAIAAMQTSVKAVQTVPPVTP